MPPKAAEPEEEKEEVGSVPVPPSLAWTDLKLPEVQAYMALEGPKECLDFIAKKMGVKDYTTNARSAVMADLYLWVLEFAKRNGLSEEKTSVCFTILKQTHEFAMAGKKSMEEAFDFCKRLVLLHSLKGVEGCVELLSPLDVEIFTDYITTTYMQHFRLYQYVQEHEQKLDQFTARLFVDTACQPPPLAIATMEPRLSEPSAVQSEKTGESAATESEGAEKSANAEPSTEAPPSELTEEDKEKAVSKALRKLLEEKTNTMREAFEEKLRIKTGTIDAKLQGLGV